jgi:hypothetical protein
LISFAEPFTDSFLRNGNFCTPVQLLDMLKFYARFEISDESGDPLTDHDMTQLHYSKITSLQVIPFRPHFELSL